MEFYQVKSGDSLVGIAREVLADETRWREIAALNQIGTPFIIQPGQTLAMPEAVVSLVRVPRMTRRGVRLPPDPGPQPQQAGILFGLDTQSVAYLALGALLLFMAMGKK